LEKLGQTSLLNNKKVNEEDTCPLNSPKFKQQAKRLNATQTDAFFQD